MGSKVQSEPVLKVITFVVSTKPRSAVFNNLF